MKPLHYFFAWSLSMFIVAGLSVSSVFAQYDYYDPYSNSNIDYYPMNPVDTSPSPTSGGGTTVDSSSGATSGGTTSSGGAVTTTTYCANKPTPNPQNTRSVEIRDKGGKVFYLSPPKEELVGIRAYPETSQKIFKITYGTNGVQISETEIGLITVSNNCYPKYGYVKDLNASVSTPTSAPLPPPPPASSITVTTESSVVPVDATAVTLNPATGKVYNAKTGVLIAEARYDVLAHKIYYKDTDSTFGKVFTETSGYVNIDLRGVSTPPPPPPSGDPDFDLLKVAPPSKVIVTDVNRDGVLDKVALPPKSVDSGSNENWDFGAKTTPPEERDDEVSPALLEIGGIPGSPEKVTPKESTSLETPNTPSLVIDLGGESLEKFRAAISDASTARNVTVRGWDPKKKEEIIAHPEVIETPTDLKIYVEAIAIHDVALQEIMLRENVLEIESQEEGKLLWFIPVHFSSRVVVQLDLKESTRDPVDVRLPWWHVFVKKKHDTDTLKGELLGALRITDRESEESRSAANAAAHALHEVAGILKSKHDTAKNSISNVR